MYLSSSPVFVGFVLLDLQFYMYVLQIVVCLQRGSCYSIFSFICMFCRSLFVFSGVCVTRSIVLFVCFVDRCLSLVGFVLLDLQFYMYVLQIVVCLQWGSCYSIFSFICMFCRSLFFSVAIVLSVLLRYTDSDYPFGIFKLFLRIVHSIINIYKPPCQCRYKIKKEVINYGKSWQNIYFRYDFDLLFIQLLFRCAVEYVLHFLFLCLSLQLLTLHCLILLNFKNITQLINANNTTDN